MAFTQQMCYSWRAEVQLMLVSACYCCHTAEVTILRRTTHHTAAGVQLPVRYAAEVAAAAPVVFRAVSDRPEGVQENLQRIKGGTDHQLFSVKGTSDKGKSVSRLRVFLSLRSSKGEIWWSVCT